MPRPLVLCSNDDGIHAPHLEALATKIEAFADVLVVAPERQRSAASHAITLHKPLRLTEVRPRRFSLSGTPVDCVKIAVDKIIKGKPDLCVSGINHGSNSSINVIYSGTMSAAMEAAVRGLSPVIITVRMPIARNWPRRSFMPPLTTSFK